MKKIFLLICLSTFPVYGQVSIDGRFLETLINGGTQLEVIIQFKASSGTPPVILTYIGFGYNSTALSFNSYQTYGFFKFSYIPDIIVNSGLATVYLGYLEGSIIYPPEYLSTDWENIIKILFDIDPLHTDETSNLAWLFHSVNSTSSGTWTNSNEPLPVELVNFTADEIEKGVLLKWETATEVNNYGFDIEKYTYDETWAKIGFVEGHGNSNSPKYYSFTDKSIEGSGKYIYRLKQIDIDGTFEYSHEVEFNLGSPNNYELTQNYPNPFNQTTEINYSILKPGHVTLKVYDVLGKEVMEIVNQNQNTGSYKVTVDTGKYTSGIYFYRIQAGEFVETKKMILMK